MAQGRVLKLAAVATAILLPLVAFAQVRIERGQTYSVLYDPENRCVFALADAALPSNIICQEGAPLWRTDTGALYRLVSGSWTRHSFTSDDITFASGDDIPRAALAEDALASVVAVPLYQLRQADLANMGISETAGDHYVVVSTNAIILRGEIADDETEASVSYFTTTLPENYVAGGDVTITIGHKYSVVGAGGVDGAAASTIDLSVYLVNKTTGAVGSDICATNAATVTTTATATAFTVTPTGLVAGDVLNVKLTTSIVENDSSTGTAQAEVYSIVVKADIKG